MSENSEKPEVRLTLGCCVVVVIGSLSHWILIRTVWGATMESKQTDWETVFGATVLAVMSAPFVIPVGGFLGLTLCRMAFRGLQLLRSGRRGA